MSANAKGVITGKERAESSTAKIRAAIAICHQRGITLTACSLIPYYMYMNIIYLYIYMLYGIQDPGPWIHVAVYTDPYPVPHETMNTVYH